MTREYQSSGRAFFSDELRPERSLRRRWLRSYSIGPCRIAPERTAPDYNEVGVWELPPTERVPIGTPGVISRKMSLSNVYTSCQVSRDSQMSTFALCVRYARDSKPHQPAASRSSFPVFRAAAAVLLRFSAPTKHVYRFLSPARAQCWLTVEFIPTV